MGGKLSLGALKGIAVMVCAVIGNELEKMSLAMILLIFLMIIDYLSGMLASRREAAEHPHNKITSRNLNE